MKHRVDIELEAFNRNVTALAAMMKRTAAQSVRDSAVMILQTGANVFPQYPEKKRPKTNKREVVRVVRRYRHGIEELAQNASIEAPGDKYLWLIARPRNRRSISRGGDRRWWVFETKEAAMEHRTVNFQGVAKAGFWSQLPALGKPIPGKYARFEHLLSVPGLKSTTGSLQASAPSVTLVNRSTAIGSSYAQSKKQLILSTVNNRIAGMTKQSAEHLARFREAGGVAWNEGAQAYE